MNRLLRLTAAATLLLVVSACGNGSSTSPAASDVPTASPQPSPTQEATAEPSETATAPASLAPSASVDPTAFTVAPNPEADALFITRDECENVADGYRLELPDAWFTNTAIGEVPPCSWFAPTTFEVDDPSEVPAEIAITIELIDGDSGSVSEDVISRETGIVGRTQEAVRVEWGSADGGRRYVYQIQLGPTPEEGPNILAMTSTEMGGDYELNKAVLDRIIATMELLGSVN
jgi:hypothetical protein